MTTVVRVGLVAVLIGAGAVWAPSPASAAEPVEIVPTTTEDVVDPDDGVLSLREAIDLANEVEGTVADPPVRIVVETPNWQNEATPLVYQLTRCDGTRASEDDENDHGDLDYHGGRRLELDGWPRMYGVSHTEVRQTCGTESGERVLDSTSPLSLDGVAILDGAAAGDGGGIRTASLYANESLVGGNRSGGAGGGVFASGDATFTNDTWVSSNVAAGRGGGVAAEGVVVLATGFWWGARVWGNEAGADGGGIAADLMYMTRETSVGHNRAAGDGGGVHAREWFTEFQPVDGPVVSQNVAMGDGGGLWVETGVIRSVEVRDNLALGDGGGVRVSGSSSLGWSIVAGNVASGDGGGVWNGGNSTVEWTEVARNRSLTGDGGGVFTVGDLDVEISSISTNDARAGSGGGVFTTGPLVLDRTRVVANSASDSSGVGGGVEVRGVGPTRITSSLVARNAANFGSGVHYLSPCTGPGGCPGGAGDHLVHLSTLVANSDANLAAWAPLGETPADVRVAGTVIAAPAGGSNCVASGPLGAPGPSAPPEAQGWQPSYSTDTSCQLLAPGSTVGGRDPRLDPDTFVPAWDSPLRGAVRLPEGAQVAALAPQFWIEDPPSPPLLRPVGPGADIGAFEGGEPLVHTVAPQRLLDTRLPSPAPLGPGGERVVQVTGAAGVPAGATGALVNLTLVDPSAGTHLTAWPTGGERPNVSNLNAPAGATVAGSASVRLSPSGSFTVRNSAGNAHVLVDVVGWFDDGTEPEGLAMTTIEPTRLIDTRSGPPLGAGATRTFDVDGGVVPAGADAVVINVTGVGASATTHLTAWEAGATRPTTSTLNLAAGATVANLAVVPIDAQGRLSVRNASGEIHVLGDVVAYLDEVGSTPDLETGVHPLTPTRAFDSRTPTGGGRLTGGTVRTVDLTTTGGALPAHARAAVVTLTVVDPTAPTHLTAWASGTTRPPTSNLNVPAGVTRANTAVVPLDADGEIDLRLHAGTAHVIVDVVGYLD